MTEQQTVAERFSGWARLSLFGHVEYAGYVQDVELFGGRFVRIDLLSTEDGVPGQTKYFGASAVYSLDPTTEEAVRAEAERRLERSRQRQLYLAAPRVEVEEETDEDDYDGPGLQ